MDPDKAKKDIARLRILLNQIYAQLQDAEERLAQLEKDTVKAVAEEQVEESAEEPARAVPPPLPPEAQAQPVSTEEPAAPQTPTEPVNIEEDETEAEADAISEKTPVAAGVSGADSDQSYEASVQASLEEEVRREEGKASVLQSIIQPMIDWFIPESGRKLSIEDILIRVFPIIAVLFGLIAFALLARMLGSHITPGIRVFLMYASSAVMGGLGVWLDKKYPKFARPLMAGAVALFYFTSYAAHFIQPTAIMSLWPSLFLMCIGLVGLLAVAEWRKSELIAVFAIFLGYVTAYVSGQDYFALVSNGLLSLAGVIFLLRNRWINLSVLAVVGAYLFHFIWATLWDHPPASLELQFWVNAGSLTSYFIIFQAGGLLSAPQLREMQLARRASLFYMIWNVTIYFSLMVWVFQQTRLYADQIHWLYLVLGALLIPCANFYRLRLRALFHIYMAMSIALITLAIITRFSGNLLYLILVMEAVVLYSISYRTGMWLTRLGGLAAVILSSAFVVKHYLDSGLFGGMLSWQSAPFAASAIAIIVISWLSYFCSQVVARQQNSMSPADGEQNSCWESRIIAWDAVLLVVFIVVIFFEEHCVWLLPAIGLLYVLAAIGLRFAPWLSAGRLVFIVGALPALFLVSDVQGNPPDFRILVAACSILLAASVILDYCFPPNDKFDYMRRPRSTAYVCGLLFCGLMGLTTIAWSGTGDLLNPGSGNMLINLAVELLLVIVLGAALRRWSLVDCGLLLVLFVAARFIQELMQEPPLAETQPGLLGFQALVLVFLFALGRIAGQPQQKIWPFEGLVAKSEAASLMLFPAIIGILYFFRNFDIDMGVAGLAAGSVAVVIAGAVTWSLWLVACGGAWLLAGQILFHSYAFAPSSAPISEQLVFSPYYLYILLGLSVLTILLERAGRLALRKYISDEALAGLAHEAALSKKGISNQLQWVCGILLLLLVLHGFYQHPDWSPRYVTILWTSSAFVLFGLGLAMRARLYPRVSFAILVAAILRAFLVDTSRLETVTRMIAYFVLAMILLLVSFIFMKLKEKIDAWD